jgi:hypothetical protein
MEQLVLLELPKPPKYYRVPMRYACGCMAWTTTDQNIDWMQVKTVCPKCEAEKAPTKPKVMRAGG